MNHPHTPETRAKISATLKAKGHKPPYRSGVNHGNWKGNSVGYNAVHVWIRKWYGTPQECENCGLTSKKKYEWANLSGEYKRDISDWARLCTSCHQLIDGHRSRQWNTMRQQNNEKISVDDSIKTIDKLSTTKRWFNGAKFFFTVKVLPPKK